MYGDALPADFYFKLNIVGRLGEVLQQQEHFQLFIAGGGIVAEVSAEGRGKQGGGLHGVYLGPEVMGRKAKKEYSGE